MQRIRRIADLRTTLRESRARGARIGFVPTMGALHDGHLALVDAARAKHDVVVMSVFVNPTQFGPTEDFTRYPRDEEGDAALASARGVDVFFVPEAGEIYPGGADVRVVSDEIAGRWEGAVRPGHFAGVLTVVAKLFNIVAPDAAVFGRKDLQQAALIRRMVRDLDFPIEIVVAPTVRESDGLARSSRNRYLRADDRDRALSLVRALRHVCDRVSAGESDAAALQREGAELVQRSGAALDYFAIVDGETLAPLANANAESAAIVAARIGTTRLIDNMIVGHRE
jgi:pantoate--beta-alanine ligase